MQEAIKSSNESRRHVTINSHSNTHINKISNASSHLILMMYDSLRNGHMAY